MSDTNESSEGLEIREQREKGYLLRMWRVWAGQNYSSECLRYSLNDYTQTVL